MKENYNTTHKQKKIATEKKQTKQNKTQGLYWQYSHSISNASTYCDDVRLWCLFLKKHCYFDEIRA